MTLTRRPHKGGRGARRMNGDDGRKKFEHKMNNRKRKHEADALDDASDGKMRRTAGVNYKNLQLHLPVGNVDGMESEQVPIGGKNIEDEPFVVQLAYRNEKLDEIKNKIGSISTSIIMFPEKQITKLKDLLYYFDIKKDFDGNSLQSAFVSIQKLVAFAALEVFRDIIPSYRLKEKIKEEEGKRIPRLKHETKRLREFERILLQYYQVYLHRLERMVKCIRRKSKDNKSQFYDSVLPSREAKDRIATIGVKCLCELLVTHPYFNYRNNIIQIIVPLIADTKHIEISDLCFDAVKRIYREDKLGEVSLEVIKATAIEMKGRGVDTPIKLLQTFLSLAIKEVKDKEKEKKNMIEIRNKLGKMSRKERKRNKRMQQLERNLLEVDAQECKNSVLENHTKILSHIFVSYFRILKLKISDLNKLQEERFKLILSPVLEGLSNFAHLISVEYFDDIISVLHNLVNNTGLDNEQALHCLNAIFTIISGDGNALDIDRRRFYCQLYACLMNINQFSSKNELEVLLKCIDSMIVRKRKELSLNRALAFVKRMAIVSLQSDSHVAASLLSAMRLILQNYRETQLLLDTESNGQIGSGVYLPELNDPDLCNANVTLLWDLHVVRRHYSVDVKKFAQFLLKCDFQNGHVASDIVTKNPLEIFQNFYDVDCSFSNLPNPSSIKANKTKVKSWSKESLMSQAIQLLENEVD